VMQVCKNYVLQEYAVRCINGDPNIASDLAYCVGSPIGLGSLPTRILS
jgi:hypothetical protein